MENRRQSREASAGLFRGVSEPQELGALGPLAQALQASDAHAAVHGWLESLPDNGYELSPELRVPGDTLERAFSRGRITVFHTGERLLGESDEVRFYFIVLMGRCKLRCRAPAPKTSLPIRGGKAARDEAAPPEDEDGLAASLDADGAVHIGYIGRGEATGLPPGEWRSPWEVLAMERTAVLMLGAEDYAATLRPLHHELQAATVRLLQERSICPQATPSALLRLVTLMRQRRLRRGTVLLEAGENQRHVFILREGSCSVLSPPQKPLPGEAMDEEELRQVELEHRDEEIGEELQRRDRLRAYSMQGVAAQLEGAATEAAKKVLKKHAAGILGKAFRGERGAKPSPDLGVAARKDGLVPTALVSEPGSIIGEEVLLYDTFRDMVVARNCYTVQAEEDCICLSLDITAFQKLAAALGPDTLVERTKERFGRHLSQHTHCRRTAMQMTKEIRWTKRRELEKQERQTLRLPPCYAGALPLDALESTDDWLTTVLHYRKPPRNDKNPGTLNCLTALALDPVTFQGGPGVGAMLEVFNNPAELQSLRDGLRYRKLHGGRYGGDRNPIGEFVQEDARYAETLPPNALQFQQGPQALMAPDMWEDSDGGTGGVFFCTEVDESSTSMPMPPPMAIARGMDISPSQGRAAPPRVGRPSGSASPQGIARSSSVPVLPRLSSSQSLSATASVEAPTMPSDSKKWMSRTASSAGFRPSASRKGGGSTREAAISRKFYNSVVGKSVLVFTDKAGARKSIMRGLQAAMSEFELFFVKSMTELWTRLNSAKDTYHALMLDLTKTELQADPFLKTIRQHHRYGRIPILVLSLEDELSETVRSNCNFVVFHPISAPMLREGLLWCLDKKALQEKSPKPEAICDASPKRWLCGEGSNGSKDMFSLIAQAAPLSVS